MDTIESVRIGVVFEDAINQLDILKCLQPRHDSEIFKSKAFMRTGNLEKNALRSLLRKANQEILEKKSFWTLNNYLQRENEFSTILEKRDPIDENGESIEQLRSQIDKLNTQKKMKYQDSRCVFAHFKDQIQEMKMKFSIEKAYFSKSAEVDIKMAQKRCKIEEEECTKNLEEMKLKLEDENHINAEMTSFLRAHIDKLRDKIDIWLEQSKKKLSEKQDELDYLKSIRAQDAEKLQELLQNYHECEKVVVEDRVQKEKQRREQQIKVEQNEAAIRIQCWWRGVMVRKLLGPYKPKKRLRKKKSATKNARSIKNR